MSNKKLIIIVAVVLALVIAVAVGVGIVFLSGEKEEVNYDDLPKSYYEVTDLYSNIKDSPRICKVNLTVETVSEELLETLKMKDFVIRDAINLIVRSSTEEQLLGEDGQLYLQEEIKRSLNDKFETDEITGVYFKQLIIQG